MSEILNATVTIGQAVGVLELILSVLICFFGYKMMKQLMAFCGFLLGFAVGYYVLYTYGGGLPAYVPFLAGVILGVVLAVLAMKLYKLGVFLYAGFLAASVVYNLSYPPGPVWHYFSLAMTLAAFILAGWLAVKFARTVLVLITGIGGAWQAVDALYGLWPALGGFGLSLLVFRLVLAALGLTYQFITGK